MGGWCVCVCMYLNMTLNMAKQTTPLWDNVVTMFCSEPVPILLLVVVLYYCRPIGNGSVQ